MQIEINSSKGEAIIHFAAAKAFFQTRVNEMSGCKTCDKQKLEQYIRGVTFFTELIQKAQE